MPPLTITLFENFVCKEPTQEDSLLGYLDVNSWSQIQSYGTIQTVTSTYYVNQGPRQSMMSYNMDANTFREGV